MWFNLIEKEIYQKKDFKFIELDLHSVVNKKIKKIEKSQKIKKLLTKVGLHDNHKISRMFSIIQRIILILTSMINTCFELVICLIYLPSNLSSNNFRSILTYPLFYTVNVFLATLNLNLLMNFLLSSSKVFVFVGFSTIKCLTLWIGSAK